MLTIIILFICNVILISVLIFTFCFFRKQNKKANDRIEDLLEEIFTFEKKVKTISIQVAKNDIDRFCRCDGRKIEIEEAKEKIIDFLLNNKEELKKAIKNSSFNENFYLLSFSYLQDMGE